MEDEDEAVPCPTNIGVSERTEKRIKDCYANYWRTRDWNDLYPEFLGESGPVDKTNPLEHDALDFLRLVWGREVCEWLSVETNRYAQQKGVSNWEQTNGDEMLAFLGALLLMGYHRLPTFELYWSSNEYVGVRGIQRHMTFPRFSALWRNLHLVDNTTADRCDKFYKVRPLVDYLKDSFAKAYNPSQELSLDESMIKCKGRAKGKVYMPNKPIKRGFKVYSLCCACCGYLLDFDLCSGKRIDPATGKPVVEKGKVAQAVKKLLLDRYEGENHVVYMDRFFTSGPLVQELQRHKIYTVGSIKKNAAGFPPQLSGKRPEKGSYVACSTEQANFYVFHDRTVVSLVSNVFPLETKPMYRREQGSKVGHMTLSCGIPPLVPSYNKFMCGVDRLNQECGTYLVDHRCRRPWMRVFVHLLQLAVTNAYTLYTHNCLLHDCPTKNALEFRQELVELCFGSYCGRKRKPRGGETPCRTCTTPCLLDDNHRLVRLSQIKLKRGRCVLGKACLNAPGKGSFSCFGCAECRVRLCKVGCYNSYHSV